MTFKEQLTEMDACPDAIKWVGGKTLEQAWAECERGEWMLWFAQQKGVDLQTLTLAKARCAKLVIHLMKDERSRNAVDVAERFGLGQATREELDEARRAASAYASNAVDYAASAAYASTDTTDAAYAASAAAVASDARSETLQKCADICREVITIC